MSSFKVGDWVRIIPEGDENNVSEGLIVPDDQEEDDEDSQIRSSKRNRTTAPDGNFLHYDEDSDEVIGEVNLDLPFNKDSEVWEILESTPAFKIVPQDPHFEPLHEFSHERFCQNRAIGVASILIDVTKRISMLKLSDPIATYEQALDDLVVLVSHGFTVSHLKDTIHDLLAIKRWVGDVDVEELEQNLSRVGLEVERLQKLLVEKITLKARVANIMKYRKDFEKIISSMKLDI